MQTQMTLFDQQSETRATCGSKSAVERGVSQPWLRPDKPWWWRQRQLQLAADEHGQRLIIYRSGEYGPSLERARAATDDFYRRNAKAALEAAD